MLMRDGLVGRWVEHEGMLKNQVLGDEVELNIILKSEVMQQ